jgi:hypothetical protein
MCAVAGKQRHSNGTHAHFCGQAGRVDTSGMHLTHVMLMGLKILHNWVQCVVVRCEAAEEFVERSYLQTVGTVYGEHHSDDRSVQEDGSNGQIVEQPARNLLTR